MATKQLLVFNGGLQTKVAPHLAEPNQAVECINVDLDKGSIYPIKEWAEDESVTANGTYPYWFKGDLITNSDITDIRSYATFGSRLYWTNGGYSAYGLMRWNSVAGVNAVPPTVTSYGTLTLTPSGSNGALNDTYAYVYTVVDADGIESVPSPVYTVSPSSQNVDITIGSDTVTEDVLYRRIYRTGGANPTYNLVAELPDGTSTFTDNILDLNVSRIELSTYDNFAPPTNLDNLCENNGTMWASVGDRVYFSENGQPEFWNPLNFVVLNDTCTGIGKFRDLTIAFTEADAYVISGFNRDTISLEKLPYNEGCLNHRSIANVTELLLWTSKNGICAFDGSSIKILTRNIISWFSDTAVGNSVFDSFDGTFDANVGYQIEYAIGIRGKYYAVYQEGIGILDLNNGIVASTVSLENAKSLYFDEDENSVVAVTDDLKAMYYSLGSDNMVAEWKTPKIQDEGHGTIKSFRRLTFDDVPDNATVYIDDKQILSIDNKRDFFLPSGAIGNTIQVHIKTSREIKSLKYEYGVLT